MINLYNADCLEKMKEIIAGQLNVNAEDVKPESRFKEDLNADSLDLFELVMALEDVYSVEIPSEELEKLGYTMYKRDYTSDMYSINNVTEYFMGKDNALYIIYAYGNENNTNEMDVVIM